MADDVIVLSEVRDRGLRWADHADDDFVSIAEANDQLNLARREFLELVVNVDSGELPEETETYATDGTARLDLPDAAWHIVAVEYELTTSGQWSRPLDKVHTLDSWKHQSTSAQHARGYRLDGRQVVLLPTPASGKTYRVRYIAHPEILDDNDVVERVMGCDEFMSVRLALYVKDKDHKLAPRLMQRERALLDRIEGERTRRILSTPGQVRDVNADSWLLWPYDDGASEFEVD